MVNEIWPGRSFPLGATVRGELGVNFSLFSKNATVVEILLFDAVDDPKPAQVFELEPDWNKTFYYWHCFVPDVGPGQLYGFRVHGPFAPERGHRFDGSKLLLDPYARAIAMGENYSREAAARFGYDNTACAMKSVVVDPDSYDWEGDAPLRLSYDHSVIYEMHVRGFTQNPNSGLPTELRGTYAGVIRKIPYLKSLGVTTVELMPVHQFDPYDAPGSNINYWGYSSIGFFAPHAPYSSRRDPLGPVDEFRDMVKALHRAGIEVILDVVYNHSAEGDHEGPTLCFRGLENRAYYHLEPDQRYYSNYAGTGNSMNANQSIMRRLILDSLRYWVAEMHVDGFRFDLASVLSRDEAGQPVPSPPILWEIESDPVLAGTKIIAEAWDAAGLYQVGSFIGDRWAEWNGRYRDDVRRFVRGDSGYVEALAEGIAGSPHLYSQPDRRPDRSINFITSHDGFTLNDLVSYNEKHNLANGEDNRDGHNANYSWNSGVEGPTDDPQVVALRRRQVKNFLTLLLCSQGAPMLTMGDEVCRTQHGNNNAYAQDNELSWFNWDDVNRYGMMLRFVRGLIRFHMDHEIFHEAHYWVVNNHQSDAPRLTWHGVVLHQPDWGHDSHSLAYTLQRPESDELLHIMINAYWEALPFELPPLPDVVHWYRTIDTNLSPPEDFCEPEAAPAVTGGRYWLAPRSVVVLKAQPGGRWKT